MSSLLYTVLTIAALLLLVVGLITSIRLVKQQKGEQDHGVSPTVKANPRTLNPVFLSYIFVFTIVVMIIWFFRLYYKYPF
ncbi:hypothetical protein BEP19_04595 [Ammoniphilus oxalaticus]|uniref:Short-chain dehydrogenase n=1 Tax=Ammoniphilus oxalaticus TaxID=66863 RepID=A0A419SM89_9BACL|nr:hypothetical protein [Ammoniphilus oxalaticus]RKD25102.1 hypothetical protein BEP19_04595 [Ammoniphilus oxalaticus]